MYNESIDDSREKLINSNRTTTLKGPALQKATSKIRILERTSNLIDKAVKCIDSEQLYNEANLDMHLMGIKTASFSKKKRIIMKHPPSVLPKKPRKKLSKTDEE